MIALHLPNPNMSLSPTLVRYPHRWGAPALLMCKDDNTDGRPQWNAEGGGICHQQDDGYRLVYQQPLGALRLRVSRVVYPTLLSFLGQLLKRHARRRHIVLGR